VKENTYFCNLQKYYYFLKRTIYICLLALLCVCADAAEGIRLKTVVIDPGHGGYDPGAVSPDRRNYEKTFTLDISKKLAEKIRAEYPDVKVILTRSKDEFVSLNDRAEIANKADADLFISIHINAARSASPNGFSLHILGQSSNSNRDIFAENMDVCKRENSVILLEDDYSTKYEGFDPTDTESYIFMLLMQNAYLEQSLKFSEIVRSNLSGGPIRADRGVWQNAFYVLWKTSMPSVLLELGFISSQTDLPVLRDPDKRTDVSERIFNAFKQYKVLYDGTADSSVQTAPSLPEVRYGVQIMAGSSEIESSSSAFMGYTPIKIRKGNIIKYVISVCDTREEVASNLVQIKRKYPGAFIVEIPRD